MMLSHFPWWKQLAVHVAGAGRLTESRTNTTGKFRKTVGLGKTEISLFEISAVNQIVGLRYQIVQGTAGSHACKHITILAEGNAALHTACPLLLLLLKLQGSFELMEMFDPLKGASAVEVSRSYSKNPVDFPFSSTSAYFT